ncbi:hypothetical protein [Paenibacillus sp. UNC496MF]|uniref:hypothetical protein n=1 Tax=Paenibacillus sp. UNC496MF TaxID=1502753 RepID=UPI001160220B|nr:hypothetical protein [Paenibacillus sp. UNC496MF]
MGDILSYDGAFDEWGRRDREPLEFQINFRHIRQLLPASCRILDNGAGPVRRRGAPSRANPRIRIFSAFPRICCISGESGEPRSGGIGWPGSIARPGACRQWNGTKSRSSLQATQRKKERQPPLLFSLLPYP